MPRNVRPAVDRDQSIPVSRLYVRERRQAPGMLVSRARAHPPTGPAAGSSLTTAASVTTSVCRSASVDPAAQCRERAPPSRACVVGTPTPESVLTLIVGTGNCRMPSSVVSNSDSVPAAPDPDAGVRVQFRARAMFKLRSDDKSASRPVPLSLFHPDRWRSRQAWGEEGCIASPGMGGGLRHGIVAPGGRRVQCSRCRTPGC